MDASRLQSLLGRQRSDRQQSQNVFPDPADGAHLRADREVVERLRGDTTYVQAFATRYGGVTRAGIEDALATYVTARAPRGSAFDTYLQNRGDIGADAEGGYTLFKSYGCVSCHQGRGVGGNMVAEYGSDHRPYAISHQREARPCSWSEARLASVSGSAATILTTRTASATRRAAMSSPFI
jgi:cytochrome c peroxidase